MPDENRHESADLTDYSVQEPSDSLTGQPGEPGDDPLDRGIAPPERWSAGMRFGSTADEQASGESLDDLLAEEEPDTTSGDDDDLPEDVTMTRKLTSTSTGSCSMTAPIRGRAAWWRRTRELIPTRRPIWWRGTSGSTTVRPARRKPPCTWWTTTTPTSVQKAEGKKREQLVG